MTVVFITHNTKARYLTAAGFLCEIKKSKDLFFLSLNPELLVHLFPEYLVRLVSLPSLWIGLAHPVAEGGNVLGSFYEAVGFIQSGVCLLIDLSVHEKQKCHKGDYPADADVDVPLELPKEVPAFPVLVTEAGSNRLRNGLSKSCPLLVSLSEECNFDTH